MCSRSCLRSSCSKDSKDGFTIAWLLHLACFTTDSAEDVTAVLSQDHGTPRAAEGGAQLHLHRRVFVSFRP